MSNGNEGEKAGQIAAVVQAVGVVLDKAPVYPDAIQPGAKQAGELLGTVGAFANLAVRPIKTLSLVGNALFDKLDVWLVERISQRPNDRVVEPAAYVAGPALIALQLAQDEPNLRDLYLNLIAASMLESTRSQVHPAFAGVIGQMTPTEARMLRFLKDPIPFLLVKQHKKRQVSYKEIGYFVDFPHAPFDWPAFENLERLKIVEIRPDLYIEPAEKYNTVTGDFKNFEEKNKATLEQLDSELKSTRGLIRITSFGRLFVAACVESFSDVSTT